MTFDAFVGPAYTAQSTNTAAAECTNLFAEQTDGGAVDAATKTLYGTPGIKSLLTLPTSPVRALWANTTSCYAVAGSHFYLILSGTLTTAGAAVTWVSGNQFVAAMAGTAIMINGNSYTVSTYNSATSLTLTDATAGTQTGVVFYGYTDRGAVGNDGLPATIIPNGNQVLIVSNGLTWCDNGAGAAAANFTTTSSSTVSIAAGVFPLGALVTWISGDTFAGLVANQAVVVNGVSDVISQVISTTSLRLYGVESTHASVTMTAGSTSQVPASSGAFLDGYFIVPAPNSRQVNISILNDGTTWRSIDFAIKEGYPDHIQSILTDHEELWIFGTDTTEIWQNTGAASFPLVRIPGSFIHHGCAAPASPVRLQNGVAWLSSDPARGGFIAYLAQGFLPARVSTHAVENEWAGYATCTDAVSFTYSENGHEFWVLTFPTAAATWCYDATQGWWHKRGYYNGFTNTRQRQMTHCFTSFGYSAGQHLMGDYSTGVIYEQKSTIRNDAGALIHRVRACPHLTEEHVWSYFHRFQLDMEVGTSTSAPTISLDWSDDGGHTFNTPRTATPTLATYAGRVIFRRLGRSRDRVFRITITDALPIALQHVYLDVTQGVS